MSDFKSLSRNLWHGGTIAMPRYMDECPECGGQLTVHCHEWEAETGQPTACGIQIDCENEEGEDGEGTRHRFWQSDWQPIYDRVRKWCGARYVLLALVAVLLGCRSERADTPIDTGDQVYQAGDAINRARRSAGREPLWYSEQLTREAQQHAEWMDRRGRLRHASITYGAENIAQSQTTGAEVVRDWMNSRGHRANILGPYTHAGLGKSGDYWCLRVAKLEAE